MMRLTTVAILTLSLAAGACNRQDSGAVGTNTADMPAETIATTEPGGAPSAGTPGYSMAGQTPAYGQPGGAPSMETSSPDGYGPSSGDSGGGAAAK